MTQTTTELKKCDYLVVGAGAASIAFIDSLLTDLPSAKIVLVDKKPTPGGHWVDAYGYVHLHQPSLLYGVASKQLEGNWLKLMLGKLTLPWHHRASKDEILAYFKEFIDEKLAKGQVTYYPSCDYDFQQDVVGDIHCFSTLDGKQSYSVKVEAKLVNGILGECKIPSQCPVEFPVDETIHLLTPNQLFDAHRGKEKDILKKKYVVLGNGKTAMDAVIYLQRSMKIQPDDITWVISNDVWMLLREGSGTPGSWPQALLEYDGDQDKASAALEARGAFVRLNPDIKPTRFRFPVIGGDELTLMRKIKNVVRRGRVTSISVNNDQVNVGFEPKHETWTHPSPAKDVVLIHCTSPGPFNGNTVDELFVSEKEMDLAILFAPPVSLSMSCMGFLEAARRNGTLDLQFGRRLLLAEEGSLAEQAPHDIGVSDNDVLRVLIRAMPLDRNTTSASLRPLFTLGLLLSLVDPDPLVGYNWLKSNRLSMLSVPNFKCKVYEDIATMSSKGKQLGFSEGELRMMSLLKERLEPLEGM